MATYNKRKDKSGKWRYTAQIRINKKNKKPYTESKTFSTKTAAKDWANMREIQLKESANFEAAIFEGTTFEKLIKRYSKEVGGPDGFEKSKQSHLNFLQKQEISESDVRDVTAADFVEHLRLRALNVQPATALNDLVYFGVVMKHARVAWSIPFDLQILSDARTTAKNAGYIAKSKQRKRRPSDDELKKIINYFKGKTRSSYPMVLIIWFEIYSARRTGEMCRILRDEIYKKNKTFEARDVKHPNGSKGNDKTSRITDRGWEVIQAILKEVPDVDGRLFPFNPKTISTYFTNACKVLGIEDLHFYDLKHESMSRMAEDGLTIPQISEISLHNDWKSLQIYVNMKPRKDTRLEFCPINGYKDVEV